MALKKIKMGVINFQHSIFFSIIFNSSFNITKINGRILNK